MNFVTMSGVLEALTAHLARSATWAELGAILAMSGGC